MCASVFRGGLCCKSAGANELEVRRATSSPWCHRTWTLVTAARMPVRAAKALRAERAARCCIEDSRPRQSRNEGVWALRPD